MLPWIVRVNGALVARFELERDARGFAKARYGNSGTVDNERLVPNVQHGRRFRRLVDGALVSVSPDIVGSNGAVYVAVTDQWGTYHIRASYLDTEYTRSTDLE